MTTEEFIRDIVPQQPSMKAVAVSVLHSDDLANDAVQDALAKLWHKRRKLDHLDNPEGYCLQVVKRCCIDMLRRRKNVQTIFTSDLPDTADHEVAQAAEERFQKVEQAIASLPPLQQDIIRMKYFEQKSLHQIAAITGLSDANLRSIISRTYSLLREKLS